MSRFDKFLGLEYDEGRQDCLTTVRNYFRDEWGIYIANMARPNKFWQDPALDFYSTYRRFGFRPVFDEPFEVGDLLIMPLNTVMNTHAAIVVEDNQILHHMPGTRSSLDPLFPKWANRANIVARHPRVTEMKKERKKTVHLHEVIDADILRNPRAQEVIEKAMESERREMRGGPS